ncbi:MAG: hypothetical protein KJ052_09475 [Candidatus Hydrogenedentes bacterium]|nr:hypothetical protein [Candidatus Hydrogenedentota bacterium]
MNLFHNDDTLVLLATIAGMAWAFFKSTRLFDRLRARRFSLAVEALEAGVEQTYRSYVRARKQAAADGKLTDAERVRARELACEAALEFGRTRGVDVAAELGREYLDLWLTRAVNKLKG